MRSTPSRPAIAATASSATSSAAMQYFGVMTVGRPSLRPRAGGVEPFVSPSTMSSRMNSARAANIEDQASTRGGGMSCSCKDRNRLAATQVGDDGDQVLQGAAESGQLGDYEGVALVLACR